MKTKKKSNLIWVIDGIAWPCKCVRIDCNQMCLWSTDPRRHISNVCGLFNHYFHSYLTSFRWSISAKYILILWYCGGRNHQVELTRASCVPESLLEMCSIILFSHRVRLCSELANSQKSWNATVLRLYFVAWLVCKVTCTVNSIQMNNRQYNLLARSVVVVVARKSIPKKKWKK